MPELPEVEAARRAVEDNCVGKKIVKCIVADDPKVIDGVSPSELQASVVGKTIVAARRKGKNMWLQLDSPPFPSFQFGMAGAIYIKGVAVTKYKRSAVNDEEDWPSKYSKFFIELGDGLELSFTDKRRFARVRLLKDPTSVPPISELGPDALLEPMTLEEFTESLHKKKTEIKPLLLDQSFISGIGNWVADEVLYQARIHPRQTATSLSDESCAALHKSIKEVIQYAVEVDAECSCFPLEWLFHFRWGKKTGKISGKQIDFITAGGRTTAYVPELQKLSGSQDVKEIGKSRRQTSKKKSIDDDDEDNEKPTNGEEDDLGSLKSKKAKKAGGGGRKPSKKKSEESDYDNDGDAGSDENDDNDNVEKKKPGGKQSKKRVQSSQNSRNARRKVK
ncbi:formamidopyrimidine-DNA glycosylase-like isoform X2 [Arachis hypogaea]|uniref:formamidopyrimidine-DNA glycosylase-like isoform X2 n=1 Tax=Arachis hypogaea TaxID=3818 RepID=UPI000DECEF89|nr:formamidopyrimidine-DNA glycosylase-like isoform X2 [Arachis hypogaea]XP_025669570.1 formamidopyrimidine-DNA glycosylase-like isoform X2 [Arachis hypogaea]